MRIAVSQQEIMQRCESETVFLQQQRKKPEKSGFFHAIKTGMAFALYMSVNKITIKMLI